jgi:hypothetical protein
MKSSSKVNLVGKVQSEPLPPMKLNTTRGKRSGSNALVTSNSKDKKDRSPLKTAKGTGTSIDQPRSFARKRQSSLAKPKGKTGHESAQDKLSLNKGVGKTHSSFADG